MIILDEAHHAGYDEDRDQGARVWSQGISYILNKGYKVLGLTATQGRTDNIDVGETLFQGCVCEGMAVEDAIEKHVIHPFSYVTAIYDTEKLVTEIKEKYYSDDEECKKLFGQLDLAINNTPTLKEIFNKYHFQDKKKGIIFIQEIADKEYVMSIFKDICPNKEFRAIDSKMDQKEVEENRKWFENTNEGYLIAVNMISEGAHYKNVDVLVMFRRTESYLVYTQQLGRIITLTKDQNPNAIVFDLVNNIENIRYNDRKLNRKKTEEHTITKIIRALQDLKSEQIIIADETVDIVRRIRQIKEYCDYFWTEEEDKILYQYYPIEGTGCRLRLKNKSKEAVAGRVHRLQIKMIDLWTEEEDEILRQYYPIEGKTCVKRFSNKTKNQIYDRAQKFHILYTNKNCWSAEEDNIIMTYYPTEGPNCINKLTNRSRSAVKTRARKLGVSSFKKDNRDWTEEEIELLKIYYPKEGSQCYRRFQDRTAHGIRGKANSLHIKSNTKERAYVCVETGEFFSSPKKIKEKYPHICIANIHRAKNGKIVGGFHWKRVEEDE